MRRRDFLKVISGSVAPWPLSAHAQQPPKRMRRLGVLTSGSSESDPEGQARVGALRRGLNALGWIEGRNLEIAYQLINLNPDVIFAAPSAALGEVQRLTRTIPVVFAQISDPVGAGFVASLSHPGGNITGFALFEFAIGTKWLGLLKQIAPNIKRVLAIYDPASPSATGYLPPIKTAGRSLGIDVFARSVHNTAEVERGISDFAGEPNSGLIAVPSSLIGVQHGLIISLANQRRLPTMSAFRYYAAAGGLASYGVDNVDQYRRAASYIDRILKGEKPGDLPVQEATKFELVINQGAATKLGLTVPQSLLAIADEVIE